MRKSRFGIGAGFMMALAGLMGTAQASQPLTHAQSQRVQGEMKATEAKQADRKTKTGNYKPFDPGAVELARLFEAQLLTPMQYGMLYGHGNKGRHTNLNRCSHNAKVKRRG